MFPAYSFEAQAPWVHGYALISQTTRNCRRSQIISHFRPGLVRLIVTPVRVY